KTRGDRRKRRRMPERIRTVEHAEGLGVESSQHPATFEQIPDDGFSAGNELVGQHVPGAGLEAAVVEQLLELRFAFGAHVQIVLEHDTLAVEEEALALFWRIVDQLIDERDESLAESLEREIPLAIPVRVCDDVNV